MIDLLIAEIQGPDIDYAGLSPLFAVAGGTVIVLMAALFRGQFVQRILVPALTLTALGTAVGLTIWRWQTGDLEPIIENALAVLHPSSGSNNVAEHSLLAAVMHERYKSESGVLRSTDRPA